MKNSTIYDVIVAENDTIFYLYIGLKENPNLKIINYLYNQIKYKNLGKVVDRDKIIRIIKYISSQNQNNYLQRYATIVASIPTRYSPEPLFYFDGLPEDVKKEKEKLKIIKAESV